MLSEPKKKQFHVGCLKRQKPSELRMYALRINIFPIDEQLSGCIFNAQNYYRPLCFWSWRNRKSILDNITIFRSQKLHFQTQTAKLFDKAILYKWC